METQSENATCSEDRNKRFTAKDTSFSLRSPLTKTHTHRDWDHPSPQRGRHGNRQRGSHRSRHAEDHKPTLAQFAPGLMSILHSSPQEEVLSRRGSARARDIANRRRRGQSEPKDASFSLRSPLDRKPKSQTKPQGSHGKRQSRTTSQSSSQTSLKEVENEATPQDSTTDRSQPHGEKAATAQQSRARKCLWADEVDEAFVDGDNLDDEEFGDSIELDEEGTESSGETDSPRHPLTEQQLARRAKDISYGKATEGYHNYIELIPKHRRDKTCPKTPEKTVNTYSRRKWDSLVHKWRRQLHRWDDPIDPCANDEITNEESTPLKGHLPHTDVDFENRTPSPRKRPLISSTRSSPSDLGYVTTPDSKGNLSWQQLDDDIDSLPPEHNDDQHFPPLVSSGVASSSPLPLPTKGVWTSRREEPGSKTEAENDSLNEFAQKLTISDAKADDMQK